MALSAWTISLPKGKNQSAGGEYHPGMTATSFIPQQVRAAGMEMKDVMTDIIENKFKD